MSYSEPLRITGVDLDNIEVEPRAAAEMFNHKRLKVRLLLSRVPSDTETRMLIEKKLGPEGSRLIIRCDDPSEIDAKALQALVADVSTRAATKDRQKVEREEAERRRAGEEIDEIRRGLKGLDFS